MSYSRYDRYSIGRYQPSSSLYSKPVSLSSYRRTPSYSRYSRDTSLYNTYPSRPLASLVYNSRRSAPSSSVITASTYRSGTGYGASSIPASSWSRSGYTRKHSRNDDERLSPCSSRAETNAVPPVQKSIEGLNLMVDVNSVNHHTDMYEMCEENYVDDVTGKICSAQLVVRRGQKFKVKLTLTHNYKSGELIRVVATIGAMPLVSKGTAVEMMAEASDPFIASDKQAQWAAQLWSFSAKEVELEISTPPTCAIGRWTFSFDLVEKDEEDAVVSLMEEAKSTPVYILFNPWCQGDAVYMESEEWREEYVLNDSGKLYRGASNRINGMPWNFGQFESVSLQAALYLLDEISEVAMTSRGSVIAVSREMSALVNSADENGVLVGNWSNDYSGGVSPTKWTGTPAILQKYMDSKKPVKYGQCWVFSGVLTTIFRSLGIPARSVTNFSSAHDADGSLTIDKHYTCEGEPLSELDSDSIWNFHVWNECWMSRPDLAAGYGGWQAVDATPQERSGGIYRAGPASVLAIKNGDVGCNYDAKFIFAEVNADQVNWFRQKNGRFSRQIYKDIVGKCISTKALGPSMPFSCNSYTPDREDITDNYKYPEGSAEERASVLRAATYSTKPQVYFDDSDKQDMTFGVLDESELGSTIVGSDFSIPLFIKNESSSQRRVTLTVTLSSVYYTGVYRKKLKKEAFQLAMEPLSEERVAMYVKESDYMDDLVDFGYAMKVDYMGYVKETKQLLATADNFRLRTLIPEVATSCDSVKVGEKFTVYVHFENPLKKPLTGCSFTFESAGNLKPTTVEIRDVPKGALAEASCDVKAKRAGECIIITAFECQEMGDIQGQASVTVKRR